MSGAATPLRRSTAVTDRAAALAWRSAVATEPALVCTPMDRDSWFGTPDTFPVPVTVMRALPAAGAAAVRAALPAASLAAAGVALPWPAPRVNAAMSRPAEATPAATARWAEENWTAMVPLRRQEGNETPLGRRGTWAGSPAACPGFARPGGARPRQPAAGWLSTFAMICLTSAMIAACRPGMSWLAKLFKVA